MSRSFSQRNVLSQVLNAVGQFAPALYLSAAGYRSVITVFSVFGVAELLKSYPPRAYLIATGRARLYSTRKERVALGLQSAAAAILGTLYFARVEGGLGTPTVALMAALLATPSWFTLDGALLVTARDRAASSNLVIAMAKGVAAVAPLAWSRCATPEYATVTFCGLELARKALLFSQLRAANWARRPVAETPHDEREQLRAWFTTLVDLPTQYLDRLLLVMILGAPELRAFHLLQRGFQFAAIPLDTAVINLFARSRGEDGGTPRHPGAFDVERHRVVVAAVLGGGIVATVLLPITWSIVVALCVIGASNLGYWWIHPHFLRARGFGTTLQVTLVTNAVYLAALALALLTHAPRLAPLGFVVQSTLTTWWKLHGLHSRPLVGERASS